MKDMSERIAHLSPEKRDLLMRQLATQRREDPEVAITRQQRDPDGHPLSFAQQRLWFLDQLTPGLTNYNVPVSMRLTGVLNVAALERSLNAIVQRHEVLRTTFKASDGSPLQVINPAMILSLPLVDLGAVPPAEREAEALRLAQVDAVQPFDLAHGPVIRTTLLRLSETDHMLLLNAHHIAFDAWSLDIFLQELAAFYNTFNVGTSDEARHPRRDIALDVPVQYVDFAAWQRQRLQGEYLARLLSYWEQQLAGAPPLLDLPTDRPRPAMQSYRGAAFPFQLSEGLSSSLRDLSRQQGSTLFMTLLAAFQTLLYRYSGQKDIVVGSPIANRARAELEGLIGFFVNTLVLRTHLDGNLHFDEVLQRVREVALGAYTHQDIPFEQLVEHLQPVRNLSHNPLFQVSFMFQNLPASTVQLADLTVRAQDIDSGTTTFDLLLNMMDTTDGLVGTFKYSTDLFDSTTIARIAAQFERLLAGIVAQPTQCITKLPLLPEAERRDLLVSWNDTRVDFPADICIHHLVEMQVARSPDAVAVICGDAHLTYAEMDRRANQLACYLRGLGVGQETRIGLAVDRSLEMVVGLMGILKAGGAYVPLDPTYPQERLAFMCADAQMPVLVTQQALVSDLPAPGTVAVCLDSDWELIVRESEVSPDSSVTDMNVAYVIYTSGSTGMPKGVQIPHRAVSNFLHAMRQRPGITNRDVLLSVTTLSFDIAVLELFLPLITGARLVLVSREMAADGTQLAASMSDADATIMQATPATWRMLLEAGWPGMPDLTILCGGEALPRDLADRLRGRCKTLWNMYGPTETTIWSAVTQVESGDGTVPIGHPIVNTQVYVLTSDMQPAPIGVWGEVYIGGAGVARGYLNRAALTAEAFKPDPFSGDLGMRLYKTGDVARYRPDSRIEFLGRRDHQVKVRGFRVELGEVEATLSRHPAVRENVVVAHEDETGEKQLIGYVVLDPDQEIATADMRRFLHAHVPAYMVPSTFVVLEALPLTPNGKVDRRALPSPATRRARLRGDIVAPSDYLETELVQIWEELLGVSPISVTDDFFDLGGHSLLAVRLVAQIRKQLGRDLPLSALFQGATIDRLARLLNQNADDALWSPLVPIQPAGTRRPVFCVHAIGGDVLGYTDLSRQLGADQPMYGLRAPQLSDIGGQEVTIEDMATSYIDALRSVQPEGPYLLIGWSFGGTVAFEMAQQLHKHGECMGMLALLDSYLPGTVGKAANLTDAMVLAVLAKEQALLSGKTLTIAVDDLQRYDSDEQLRHVLEQIERAQLDFETERAWVQRFLQGYRARQRAACNYKPQIYPGRITLFKSTRQDPEIVKALEEIGVDLSNATYGWDALTTEKVEILEISAYHNTLIHGPHARLVAEQLQACFDTLDVELR